jgi:hypothetical protein
MVEVPDNVGEVARALAPLGLLDDVVFVGGAVVPMLLSDPAALPARVTADVDVVVDVVGRARFYDIEATLREAGHAPDPMGPICRWRVAGVPLDLMPTDPAILGFSNRWYPTLVRTARRHRIAPDVEILVAHPGMLLATKLEAHADRGRGDLMLSHDLTDVVSLVEGRPELVDEVANLDDPGREFVREALRTLLAHDDLPFALAGHLPPDAGSQARVGVVLERLGVIAGR